MDSSSPIPVQQTPNLKDSQLSPKSSPKPSRKSFASSLMGARAPSFREDTYFISHLNTSERKALKELKDKLITDSTAKAAEYYSVWGVPLLAGADERADVILLKFLRARDFSVHDSLDMLLRCLAWRKDFGADVVLEEDLGFEELEAGGAAAAAAYMHGYDREGHPVCYNAYGVFKDKEMYDRVFGDDEKVKRFLRWRVGVLERGIRLLDFKPGGVNSIIQVTDLKDMPKGEMRVASNQILPLFQNNYPEMVAKKIFINVPWYFSLLYSVFSVGNEVEE